MNIYHLFNDEKIPPFTAIRAFEAAARNASFKRAAEEIAVTPTAVSHQIRRLEADCGRILFARSARKVTLTKAGKAFYEALTPALESIADAYFELKSNTNRTRVILGAGPIIASKWLVPRLPEFWRENPEIDLLLHHSPYPVWEQIDNFDLAIAWGHGNWPNVCAHKLLTIEVSPVVSPSFLANVELNNESDFLNLPLLHHRDNSGWHQWLAASEVKFPNHLPGTTFEDANVLLQAAMSGRGVALGIFPLIEDDLKANRLIQPFQKRVEPCDAYYLIYSKHRKMDQYTKLAIEWLLQS